MTVNRRHRSVNAPPQGPELTAYCFRRSVRPVEDRFRLASAKTARRMMPFRPHRIQSIRMRPIVTNGLSVCVCLDINVTPTKRINRSRSRLGYGLGCVQATMN